MTQDQKLDLLLKQFHVMDGHMISVENHLEAIDRKVDVLSERVDNVERKVDALSERVDRVEGKSDKHYYELRSMDAAILDEVERVHKILMRHQADRRVHRA